MIRPRTWNRSLAALSAAVLAGGISCSLLMARPGKVVTKQGQSIEGDITERPNDGAVDIVRPNREKVTVRAGNVQRIDYADPAPDAGAPAGANPPATGAPGSPDEDFRRRLAALPPRDVANRIKLARWAFDQERYDLSREALQQAIQIDPRNEEARTLLNTVDAQERLHQRTQGQGQGQQPGAQRPGQPQPQQPMQDPSQPRGPAGQGQVQGQPQGGAATAGTLPPPLSPDDINRVRQLEWTRNDRGVRVRLLNDVKRRYVSSARDVRPADFNNLNAIEQGWQIVRKGTDDMANDVRLVTDPASLAFYRTQVQRALLTGCAAAACHSAGGPARFQMYPRADHEGEAYANFLALSTYSHSGGEGANARKSWMIDRDRPNDSLLLQFALPQNVADNPHPEVPGFKPVFRTLKDPKYDQFLRWISNDLNPLQKDYGVGEAAGGGQGQQPAPGQAPAGQPQQGAGQAPPAGQPGQPAQRGPQGKGEVPPRGGQQGD